MYIWEGFKSEMRQHVPTEMKSAVASKNAFSVFRYLSGKG